MNPLTGEGIDYALESGKMAAEYLAWMFEAGDATERHPERSRRGFYHLGDN